MKLQEIKKLADFMDENELNRRVVEEIIEDSKDYDGTETEKVKARINDILQGGCESGIVASLIYYEDIENFFNTYYDEIHSLLNYLEVEIGFSVIDYLKENGNDEIDIVMNAYSVKNHIVWLAYEYITELLNNILEDT